MGNIFTDTEKEKKPKTINHNDNNMIQPQNNNHHNGYFNGSTSQEETDKVEELSESDSTIYSNSDQSEITFSSNIINELVIQLTFERNNQKIDKLLELLEKQLININGEEVTLFWEVNGNIILSKIKHNPEFCINLKMHLLPNQIKNQHIEKLGILIFNTHQNDSLALLHNNMNKILVLLNKDNKAQAAFLANESANPTRTLSHAYKCLGLHKWGMAYILFIKANEHKAATKIIATRAPEYIKTLLNIH